MAHWAKVENDVVTMVLVGDNLSKDEGKAVIESLYPGEWIKTSINTYGNVHYTDMFNENGQKVPSEDQSRALRYNYAGIGYSYNRELDAFIAPKPFQSWLLDEKSCLWVAPIEKPTEGDYVWNEESLSWIEVVWDADH